MQELLPATLAYLVQLFGGSLGAAILALSLGIRVALLPLTLKLAQRSWRSQAIVRAMQPEIDALRKRHAKQPERLFAEMQQVHRRHGYRPLDLPTLLGGFVQVPIFAVLYRTIRSALTASGPFLWIRNLASPNFVLTLVILSFTALSAYLMPAASANARTTMIVLQVLVTSLIVWKLAAGLGLYWAASNVVGVIQTLWLRHRLPPPARAV